MNSKVAKAVIPAAGRGTRLLPFTGTLPKGMMPIVDTPVLQYVVEEVIAAGIGDVLLIGSVGESSPADYFDRTQEVAAALRASGEQKLADHLSWLGSSIRMHYVHQRKPDGLARAIGHARGHVGEEPFAVLLGDTIVDASPPVVRELVTVHRKLGTPVIAVEPVPPEKVAQYGIVVGQELEPGLFHVRTIQEKPEPCDAGSNLAVVGRYVLTPDIFDCIDQLSAGVGNEYQLSDALACLCEQRQVLAYRLQGVRHDLGNRLDYLQGIIRLAAAREDVGPSFRAFLREFVRELSP
jgi:UTP--glucose-1-phosphate uridylyltransferase